MTDPSAVARELLLTYFADPANWRSLQDLVAAALTRARREGAEEMRERAAKVADECEWHLEKPESELAAQYYDAGMCDASGFIAQAIRAIPLPAQPEDAP